MGVSTDQYFGKNNEVGIHTPASGSQATHVLGIGNASPYHDAGTGTAFKGIHTRFVSEATSGDIRGMYLALTMDAAGTAHCDALRAITTVNKDINTARGAHITLDFAATAGIGQCSGLGLALGATLMIPDIASWAPAGTYAAIQAEIYSWGTASDPAGMTALSFIRIANSGGTGKTNVDDDAVLFDFTGFTEVKNSGTMIQKEGNVPTEDNTVRWIKCRVNGTVCWLCLFASYEQD